jgi:hypothetical protein
MSWYAARSAEIVLRLRDGQSPISANGTPSLTALEILMVFRHFDDDRCHTQRPVMARLTHDSRTIPRSGTTGDTATFSPTTREVVTF